MSQSAEDYMQFLESSNSFAEMIDTLKRGLVDRGWSDSGAEAAAIMWADNSIKMQMLRERPKRRLFG